MFLRQAGALVVPRGAELGLLWPATRRAIIRSAKSRAVELIEPFAGADDFTVADVATLFAGALRANPPYRSVRAWMGRRPSYAKSVVCVLA
jgi:glutathione S-transferase